MKKSYSGVTRTSSGRLRKLGDPTGPVRLVSLSRDKALQTQKPVRVLGDRAMWDPASGTGLAWPGELPQRWRQRDFSVGHKHMISTWKCGNLDAFAIAAD
uniref:Uncharacterized protein n=1 Tax=Rousettus aegyptiacus TaxID=9407 RepID=A0A7J8GFN3_ROUAE|nr:hypothetical protein HJG63_017381 [Rousettus aegyptiacus]